MRLVEAGTVAAKLLVPLGVDGARQFPKAVSSCGVMALSGWSDTTKMVALSGRTQASCSATRSARVRAFRVASSPEPVNERP